MRIRIRINSTDLDLLPDTDLWLDKLQWNLSDLQSRQSEVTKEITLPNTDRNRAVLFSSLPSNRFSGAASSFVENCLLFIDNVEVVKGTFFITEENKDTIEGYVVGGLGAVFSKISDASLRDLPAETFDFTETNIKALSNTNNGLRLVDCYSYSKKEPSDPTRPFRLYQNEGAFGYSCRRLLEDIFNEQGITFVNSSFLDEAILIITVETIRKAIENGNPTPSTSINLRESLPDISQRDFVKDMLGLYGAVPNMVSFSEIEFIPISNELGSDYITLKVDHSRPIEYLQNTNIAAQKNLLRFNSEEPTDKDSSFPSDSLEEGSEQDAIVISQPTIELNNFGQFYEEQMFFPTVTVASAVINETDLVLGDTSGLQVNDGIQMLDNSSNLFIRKIVEIKDETDVTISPGLPTGISGQTIGRAFRLVRNDAKAYYAKQLTTTNSEIYSNDFITSNVTVPNVVPFDFNDIKDEYYSEIVNALESPIIVKVWTVLNIMQYKELNVFRPVYIPELGQKFYLNKIEQWRPGQPTRLELIKL